MDDLGPPAATAQPASGKNGPQEPGASSPARGRGPLALMRGHEQVLYGNDPASGLRCIIAVHSTALGPALGGTRFMAYASEEAALRDVLRLSRAMTLKAACAELDVGGGKAVILGDPASAKTEALLRAYGRMVASLGGRYVTACDMGTEPADMALVRRETRWATGADPKEGGSGDSGVMTALGVHVGLRACAQRAFGDPDLSGVHVAIQGVGKVGRRLAELLSAAGARLTIADIDTAAADAVAQQLGAQMVDAEEILRVPCEVISPNAVGGVLNDDTVPALRCRVVAGAANNQLATAAHGEALHRAGILYAPDHVINAGGLIQVADELHPDGGDPERVRAAVERIEPRLTALFALADAEGTSPAVAAMSMAERRIAEVGRLRSLWLPNGGPGRS